MGQSLNDSSYRRCGYEANADCAGASFNVAGSSDLSIFLPRSRRLMRPHLPLVVLEGAGVPLDPAFAEQKKILNRCHGLFDLCADGAEGRALPRYVQASASHCARPK
jgi:hypothetical protein